MPIGIKATPMMKNVGKTVPAVKMGCHAGNLCCLKALSKKKENRLMKQRLDLILVDNRTIGVLILTRRFSWYRWRRGICWWRISHFQDTTKQSSRNKLYKRTDFHLYGGFTFQLKTTKNAYRFTIVHTFKNDCETVPSVCRRRSFNDQPHSPSSAAVRPFKQKV